MPEPDVQQRVGLNALFDSNYVLNRRLKDTGKALATARADQAALAADNQRLRAQLAQDVRRRKTRVLRPVHASLGLECEYRRRLQCLIDEMNASVRYWLRAKYKGNEPEISQLEDEDQELALDQSGAAVETLALEAEQHDKLGFLTGAEIETSDADYWNAHYDFDNDLITLRKAFFQLPHDEMIHVLLHEAGHRGQALHPEVYEEFNQLGLARLKSLVQMANRVHLEDYQRTGKVDGGIEQEVFAESYSRWCLDREMPQELREFWNRMASGSSEAGGPPESHRPGLTYRNASDGTRMASTSEAADKRPKLDSQTAAGGGLPQILAAGKRPQGLALEQRDGVTDPQALRSDRSRASLLAADALPANALRRAVRKLARRWQKRFNSAADNLAKWFAVSNRRRSTQQLQRILREGGWSVPLEFSQAQRDILQATIHENVSLIRSIPQQYFTQVEGMVMRSVQSGRDLHQLSTDLRRQFGVTKRRAELIARDQNNKTTAVLHRTHQIELGIEKAIWVHSHAGKTYRRTHIANDGKEFNVKTGWFDSDPKVRRYIQPGELINCKCFSRSIIPGFS